MKKKKTTALPLSHTLSPSWTRRAWLSSNTAALLTAAYAPRLASQDLGPKAGPKVGSRLASPFSRRGLLPGRDQHADRIERGPVEALAQQAVEAARAAGAQYADARLTRVVQHGYRPTNDRMIRPENATDFSGDSEMIGAGVRVLVNGYWGFSASYVWEPDEMVRLGREAVSQARENALGTPRTVDWGSIPVVTGSWSTPIRIDPFTISLEEKQDTIEYWSDYSHQLGLGRFDPGLTWLQFNRQEHVLATSEGTCVTQTTYESGGTIELEVALGYKIKGVEICGKGWELLLDAKIVDQLDRTWDEIRANRDIGGGVATVGRYTLVCDGATMASIVENTFGLATQLDRALGYEADANGTSYIDDPLAMLGNLQVASPHVTVTANRSVPGQLATVKWDDEGVVPGECTLVKGGVLNDFQTTREQAAWLAPYYAKHGRPVKSHGHAAAQDALVITMQHMPNLVMEPNRSAVSIEDLVATVPNGLLVTNFTAHTDHQARNGFLTAEGDGRGGAMRKITNGRLGDWKGGAGVVIPFNTHDLWQRVVAVGGATTQVDRPSSQYNILGWMPMELTKGQPPQRTSHTVRGVAATITNQALVMEGKG